MQRQPGIANDFMALHVDASSLRVHGARKIGGRPSGLMPMSECGWVM